MIPLLLGAIGLLICLIPPAVVLAIVIRQDRHKMIGHSSATHRLLQEHIGNDALDNYHERNVK